LHHTNVVSHAAFDPEGERLATASYDRTVKIWSTQSYEEIVALIGHTSEVIFVQFSPVGDRILTYAFTGNARVWDSTTGAELRTLVQGNEAGTVPNPSAPNILAQISVVAGNRFSPDGTRVVLAGPDGTALVLNIDTGETIHTLDGGGNSVYRQEYGPLGKRIVTHAYVSNEVRVWDAETGELLYAPGGHEATINFSVFSPDGSILVTTSEDGTSKLWETDTGEEIITLRGHLGQVYGATFSPDGTKLATGSADRTVKVWDVSSGESLVTLAGHIHIPIFGYFSPDGSRIVTHAALDSKGPVRLWDLEGHELLRIPTDGPATHVRWAPDGSYIVSSLVRGVAQISEAVLWNKAEVFAGPDETVDDVLERFWSTKSEP
ncbi:WD40 repeat domain-containing protein, partial [bacterium AH-315-P07]|nr:WD40 repeat domain-containing protein [bacterium AH-315-P07]